MLGYVVVFLLGMLIMRYIENQEFKAKVNGYVKGFFTKKKP